jgi:quinoprotein dehydrogenase-associated probable ABC transporter substrate-binding protein
VAKRHSSSSFACRAARLCALFVLIALGAQSAAQEEFSPRALRVCQDPNNLPFSNEGGEGFENRIASLLAKNMNLPLEQVWYPQRINIVRNTLRYKLPGMSDYRCDLLTGVPAGWGAVASTRSYFRSTYVMAYVRGRALSFDSPEAFLALPREQLSRLKIGIYDRTPATQWLLKHGLIAQAVPFRILNADPHHYPGRIVERELAQGKLDVVIIWGPIGGYFARRAGQVDIALVPLKSEPGVQFDFAVAMGVRHGEEQWLKRVDEALAASQEEINAVLREYGVPLVDDSGTVSR